ncbi:MAG: hypothetical protein HY657_17035 [Acidobacteria bacterium]|nr:hypothetical protein [Acidobacteriota bacterium]
MGRRPRRSRDGRGAGLSLGGRPSTGAQGAPSAVEERGGAAARPAGGALKMVTTNLRAGYLRRNGVPFSEDAMVSEYFNIYVDIDGTT